MLIGLEVERAGELFGPAAVVGEIERCHARVSLGRGGTPGRTTPARLTYVPVAGTLPDRPYEIATRARPRGRQLRGARDGAPRAPLAAPSKRARRPRATHRRGAWGTLAAMPPKPGDTLDLAIDTLAYGGQGIGRVDGFVVFVRGVLPGDVARVEVTRRRSGYAEARLVELVTPSPRRVPLRCDHPADVGGCEWQTFDYDSQLEFKHRQVVEALAHIGGLEHVEVTPIRGMADPWRYRNKMEYSFGRDGAEIVLGMHRRGSWRDIVDVPDCHLAPIEISRARTAVLNAARELRLPAYSQIDHTGLLRHLVVRRGLASGDLLLNLFITAALPPGAGARRARRRRTALHVVRRHGQRDALRRRGRRRVRS